MAFERKDMTGAGHSTLGRPRSLTDAQVAAILEWQRTRRTSRQLAAELGVPHSTVLHCLDIRGEYKKPGRLR